MWAKSVRVYFQKKAWVNREFCVDWANTHLREILEKYHWDEDTGVREEIYF